MLDINNSINEESLNHHDPDGNMFGLLHWSPKVATQLARQEEIEELTEAHWQIIYALRELYRKNGPAANARSVIRVLEQRFVSEGGLKYLYELFPKGPVSQGSRLAGIPAPPNSSDPSFGWGSVTGKENNQFHAN